MSQPLRSRSETLDALITLFSERGFMSMRVEDMARSSRCSKSTLYEIASSKGGIIVAVVREFFRRATEQTEQRVAGESPKERLGSYLSAIATVLEPVEGQFVADMARFPPTREIYLANIRMAAQRVQQLAVAALPINSTVNPHFVGYVAGLVMEAVHRGDIQSATGLSAADSYSALSELLSAGVKPVPTHQGSDPI